MSVLVTAPPVPTAAERREPPLRDLPVWPVYALFVGFPVWWLLGVGSFAVVLLAVPMLLALVLRGGVVLPRAFGFWLVFLVFSLAAAVQIDGALRLVGFALRAGNYVGATIVFLYLYNLPRRRLPDRRVVYAVLTYWAFIVFGGYLGLLLPDGGLTTPLSRVLPGAVLANDYVQSLVRPNFAEVQDIYGASTPFSRPSAPFAYTNGWGCAYALLLPVVLLGIQIAHRVWIRRLLIVLLVLSVLPAFATLNRGMFLAVTVALTYVAVRLGLRGQVRLLVAVVALAVGGLVVASALGVQDRIAERTSVSGTNFTRLTLYAETIERTLQSPVLGYGAPRPSERVGVSVGTQGQVWNVMFSFGFIALGAYLAWFWSSAWRSRRARDPVTLWLHVTLVVASFAVFYYGFDGMHTSIVMVAAALTSRPPETAVAVHADAARARGPRRGT